MSIEEISKEIEGYFNENTNGLIYIFRNACDENEATGIYELSFDVQHHIRTWAFVLEYTLNQEGSPLDVNRGAYFPPQIETVARWYKPACAND